MDVSCIRGRFAVIFYAIQQYFFFGRPVDNLFQGAGDFPDRSGIKLDARGLDPDESGKQLDANHGKCSVTY
jgi:hypothetical protein